MIKILAIDGGGIRGIIPALFLDELERRIELPTAKLFDLIAGTSTGGVIALGLTRPDDKGEPVHKASDLVKFYEEDGPKIFHRSAIRAVTSLGNLIDEKYPADELEKVLHRYFGQTYLNQALTEVMVPAYEIERRRAYFFKSYKAKYDPKRNFLMKDVAHATGAAPTYFEPEKIKTQDSAEYYAFIDGGVFANNPAMCAFVEAKARYPEEKEFLIVSLGTGELTKPIYFQQASGWGLAQWAQPILKVVFDGLTDSVDYQLSTLFPDYEGRQSYFRFQIMLDDTSDDLDNTTPVNLRALKLYGEELIRANSDEINSLCLQLTKA